jgi:ferredoxin-NADP reductase
MDATVVVTSVQSVGPRTVAIEFESPDGFDARPGQFVKLSATLQGEEYSRFYTLSSPNADETFEVTVEVDPDEGGPFSEYLESLAVDSTLELSGPFGNQFYEGEPRAVVLAGGPGVGAAVGIAERALREGNQAAIVYRYDLSPVHRGRLGRLRGNGATVKTTDGPIAESVADVVTGDPGEEVYVYGFDPFVDEATAALEAAGFDPDAAKVESFG